MKKNYLSSNKTFLDNWKNAVHREGIKSEDYSPLIKVIEDESKKSKYTFGAFFNPCRFKKPHKKKDDGNCALCFELKTAQKNPIKNLIPNISKNFIVTYNRFSHLIGSSMAITKLIDGKERPMYDTSNLESLKSDLEEIFEIADKIGFSALHQTFGAGASIPQHEHWHFINFNAAYNTVGKNMVLMQQIKQI